MMEIQHEELNGALKMALNGELDASSAIEVDKVIRKAYEEGIYRFMVDCSGLSYISSAGVGVFVSYIEDLKTKKGNFVFYGMRDNVLNVFQTLELDRILRIEKDEAAARKKINES